MSCHPLSTPDTMWNFCPSVAAASLFLLLFALTTAVHILQAVRYRKAYCWVIIFSGIQQTLTFVFRVVSIQVPDSFGMYAAWFVLILVAPLWTNAFAYMVFGRLVWGNTKTRRIWGVRAVHFGPVFVVLDVVAFIVQLTGATRATSNDGPPSKVLDALHIYMGGVGLQLLFILVCTAFAVKLVLLMRETENIKMAMQLVYVQFAVLALIVIRIVFRIVEYSNGLDSSIPHHEVFMYTLDSLPMLLAIVAYNFVHPGPLLSDMPSMWRRSEKS